MNAEAGSTGLRRPVSPPPRQPGVEEGDGLGPDLVGLLGVVGAERVVGGHEGVAGAFVHREGHVLAHALQLGLERLGRVRAEEVVLLGHVALHPGFELRPVRLHVALGEPVEGDDGADLVRAVGGDDEGQHPAHAEPDHADAVTGHRVEARQVVDGAAHVPPRPVGRHGLHELRGLVHLVVPGQLAVVEVGGQRHEPRLAEAVRHLLDPPVEAPPLLHHEDTGARTARGPHEVARRRPTVALEVDHLTHEAATYNRRQEGVASASRMRSAASCSSSGVIEAAAWEKLIWPMSVVGKTCRWVWGIS